MLSTTNVPITMKTYIDERPFEVMIKDVNPTGIYSYIEDMIRRDVNVFRGDSTIYDFEIYKMEEEIKGIEKELQAIADRMTADGKIRETLANLASSNNNNNNKKVKYTGPQPMDAKEFEALFAEKLELRGKQQDIEEKLELWNAVKDVTVKEFISLNRIAKLYKKTGDDQILKQGVHWCCSYADKLIDKIPNARNSVPGLIRPAPFSAQNLNGDAW